jgi:hypothetical protein
MDWPMYLYFAMGGLAFWDEKWRENVAWGGGEGNREGKSNSRFCHRERRERERNSQGYLSGNQERRERRGGGRTAGGIHHREHRDSQREEAAEEILDRILQDLQDWGEAAPMPRAASPTFLGENFQDSLWSLCRTGCFVL